MYYEYTFIARQDLSLAQVEALTKSYVDLIKNNGGDVKEQEYWGLKQLAYPIRKNAKGHYVFFRMKASADALNELNRQVKINENILRNLVVKVHKLDEGPSAMMQAPRREREDHHDRYDHSRSQPVNITEETIVAQTAGDVL